MNKKTRDKNFNIMLKPLCVVLSIVMLLSSFIFFDFPELKATAAGDNGPISYPSRTTFLYSQDGGTTWKNLGNSYIATENENTLIKIKFDVAKVTEDFKYYYSSPPGCLQWGGLGYWVKQDGDYNVGLAAAPKKTQDAVKDVDSNGTKWINSFRVDAWAAKRSLEMKQSSLFKFDRTFTSYYGNKLPFYASLNGTKIASSDIPGEQERVETIPTNMQHVLYESASCLSENTNAAYNGCLIIDRDSYANGFWPHIPHSYKALQEHSHSTDIKDAIDKAMDGNQMMTLNPIDSWKRADEVAADALSFNKFLEKNGLTWDTMTFANTYEYVIDLRYNRAGGLTPDQLTGSYQIEVENGAAKSEPFNLSFSGIKSESPILIRRDNCMNNIAKYTTDVIIPVPQDTTKCKLFIRDTSQVPISASLGTKMLALHDPDTLDMNEMKNPSSNYTMENLAVRFSNDHGSYVNARQAIDYSGNWLFYPSEDILTTESGEKYIRLHVETQNGNIIKEILSGNLNVPMSMSINEDATIIRENMVRIPMETVIEKIEVTVPKKINMRVARDGSYEIINHEGKEIENKFKIVNKSVIPVKANICTKIIEQDVEPLDSQQTDIPSFPELSNSDFKLFILSQPKGEPEIEIPFTVVANGSSVEDVDYSPMHNGYLDDKDSQNNVLRFKIKKVGTLPETLTPGKYHYRIKYKFARAEL